MAVLVLNITQTTKHVQMDSPIMPNLPKLYTSQTFLKLPSDRRVLHECRSDDTWGNSPSATAAMEVNGCDQNATECVIV